MQKTKKLSWQASPTYRNWVNARNQAAEVLLNNKRQEVNDVLRKSLTNVLWQSKLYFTDIKNPQYDFSIDHFEGTIKNIMRSAATEVTEIVRKLRKLSYLLAKASESEILARLMPDKEIKAKVDSADLTNVAYKPAAAGGDLGHRIKIYFEKLGRKIVSQAQSAAINNNNPSDFLNTITMVFPKKRFVSRPRRALKPLLREATRPVVVEDKAMDFLDPESWSVLVDDYLNEYTPRFRSPEHILGASTNEADELYGWEVERDMTHEFVQSVRDGENEAAREAGIVDFIWVAVVDQATDACCLWRDGLLISEIEQQLDQHEDEDQECNLDGDGILPPIHFNCRCSIAPATENIPDKPEINYQELDEWLTN